MTRKSAELCSVDLSCCRNDGHNGEHLYPTQPKCPTCGAAVYPDIGQHLHVTSTTWPMPAPRNLDSQTADLLEALAERNVYSRGDLLRYESDLRAGIEPAGRRFSQ